MLFSAFYALAATAASVTAAPQPRDLSSRSVRAIWSHDKVGDKVSTLKVFNADQTELYGESQENAVTLGGSTLSFDVDENGKGTVSLDDKTYEVTSKDRSEGGVDCFRMYNDHDSQVNCVIPISGDFKPAVVRKLAARNTGAVSSVEKRQGRPPPCFESRQTELVGDGNPHVDAWHEQKTPNANCQNAASCGNAFSEGVSTTVGFSAGVSPFGWISGGFDVSESRSESFTVSCNAEPGDVVCVWHKMLHMAYTVENIVRPNNMCDNTDVQVSDPFIIQSPMEHHDNAFYCVVNQCRTEGQGYWEYDVPA